MTDDNDDVLVTSHSDENPELSGGESGPLCAHTTEGSAVSQLYEKDKSRIKKGLLGVTEEESQHLLEYQDNEGNYYYYE